MDWNMLTSTNKWMGGGGGGGRGSSGGERLLQKLRLLLALNKVMHKGCRVSSLEAIVNRSQC